MKAFVLRLLINALAIFAAVKLLPGLHFDGTWVQLAGVALVFGLLNAFIKPILTVPGGERCDASCNGIRFAEAGIQLPGGRPLVGADRWHRHRDHQHRAITAHS